MRRDDFPAPEEGFVVTQFLVAADTARSRDFYANVLGGDVVLDGDQGAGVPAMVKVANTWIIINAGGGPTEDKPDVILDVPDNPNRVSAFMNIRVADIAGAYEDWRARGAEFLTPPQDRGAEIRCYMRDPDGHLIEIGQATGMLDALGVG